MSEQEFLEGQYFKIDGSHLTYRFKMDKERGTYLTREDQFYCDVKWVEGGAFKAATVFLGQYIERIMLLSELKPL